MAREGPQPTPDDFNGIRDRVVEMFIQRHKPTSIAKALNLQVARVDRIIKQEFDKRLGDRQQQIVQAVLELDYLMKPLWKKYIEDAEAGKPGVNEYRALLDGHKERRKLLGLDAAVKVDVNITDERTEDELLEELKRNNIDVKVLQLPPPVEEVVDAEVEQKEPVPEEQQ